MERKMKFCVASNQNQSEDAAETKPSDPKIAQASTQVSRQEHFKSSTPHPNDPLQSRSGRVSGNSRNRPPVRTSTQRRPLHQTLAAPRDAAPDGCDPPGPGNGRRISPSCTPFPFPPRYTPFARSLPIPASPSCATATKNPLLPPTTHHPRPPQRSEARRDATQSFQTLAMEGGMGGGGGGGGEVEVVHMEDAVRMLVEHLVRPVLPRGAPLEERHLAPEKQRDVAQQIHTAVVLYNYYHRKLSAQLAFADAKRFLMCASLSVGEDLLAYLDMVHERDNNSREDVRLSVTDRAAMDACEIAERLDASKDSPDMTLWPISKVAVLLLNPTRKQCLIEYSSNTKGVWSIIEKEFDAVAGNSHSSNQPTGQGSTSTATFGAFDGPYMLQQLAFSEVEHRTGMKRSNLHLLDEDLAYSLSKKGTATKLFIVEYEQTMKSNLVEMPLEELISSMTGTIFVNDPFPRTSSVVEYYHILPYKEILFELLHRKWPSDSSLNVQSRQHGKCSLHSVIDENLEEQEANSKSKLQRRTMKVSTPKQNKQVIKATSTNSDHNCSTSKNRKNSKRKSEASRATAALNAEDREGGSPTKQNDTLVAVDVETSKLATKSTNAKETAVAAKASVQMDKKKTQKQPKCGNIPRDDFGTKAPSVDPVMKNAALEGQNMEVSEKSGGITKCNDDQIYSDALRSIQKIQDGYLRQQFMLEDRTSQCDMDIQKILSEGKLTPKVLSIIDKYKNINSDMTEVASSSCSGEGSQTVSTKRKRLTEATVLSNTCQELDKTCRESNWILPRYTIVPSVTDGMFYASVRLIGPDFDMSTHGGRYMTQREARCSAASNMILELLKIKHAQEEQPNLPN